MGRREHDVARRRQKKLERRNKRERKNRQLAPVTLSHKLTERLDDAYDLIRRRNYTEAEELLQKVDRRGTSYPEIVEALVYLYQSTGDHDRCCEAAERLTHLRPRDAEARLIFAQESMFCGQAAIARLNYQQFIERWPEHSHVSKAKNALEILVPETEDRIKSSGFPQDHGLDWMALHEASLSALHSGRFSECAAKCRELLSKAPNFVSARNNLAIAYFQSGRSEDAVAVVEETRRLVPGNRFAEATLAKLYFLTGRMSDSQLLADQIVADPPLQQDSVVAALEMLAFLGRDEDIVKLADGVVESEMPDDDCRAIRLHYRAYAKCRMGDEKAAKESWNKCLQLCKHHPDARENLLDLDSGDGHAPWADSLAKWIPKDVMTSVMENMRAAKHVLLANAPAVARLVPALLDRGDPLGREVAVRLAKADGSPPMIDALKTFALGTRGPDSMRFDVLMFLKEKGAIGAGPHHVYSHGQWADVELLAAEITYEPKRLDSLPRVRELTANGMDAMRVGDYERAEAAFHAALECEPDSCTAAYNLCTVWLSRNMAGDKKRARARLEQLHHDFPDYFFALIALAQFAAMDGEFQKARDLLAPVLQAKKLHIAEATALFTAQVQIALEEFDIEGAQRALEMLRQLADDGNEHVEMLRRRIDNASKKRGLRRSQLTED